MDLPLSTISSSSMAANWIPYVFVSNLHHFVEQLNMHHDHKKWKITKVWQIDLRVKFDLKNNQNMLDGCS
jgi:hypothetical protein